MRKRAIHAVPVARPLGELIAGPSREPALGPLLSALGPVVYAIRTRDGLVKIGWTANLGQRYSSLGHVSDILGWQSGTFEDCLLYTSPSPRDRTRYRMPSSA